MWCKDEPCICPALDAPAVEDPPVTPSSCQESVLRPCRFGELRPRLQHHWLPVPGPAAGLCVSSRSPVRHHGSRPLHRVGHPWLSLRGRWTVRPHEQTTHGARRVRPQRKVTTALLGQELCRLAAVLLPPAQLCSQGSAAVGGEREAALAGHTERGRSSLKGRTEKTDWAPWLHPQVRGRHQTSQSLRDQGQVQILWVSNSSNIEIQYIHHQYTVGVLHSKHSIRWR